MKRLNSSTIKKIIYGIVATDGSINAGKFDLFTKSEEYSIYVENVLKNIPNLKINRYLKIDKRNENWWGYRVLTSPHEYFVKIGREFYQDRKKINKYICDRLDEKSFANMWMCDGYLEHAKNRRKNTLQNIGHFCLEKYPKEELELIQNRLKHFGIDTTLSKEIWGFGYRIRIGGINLQKFISLIYPHMINDFLYKTEIYYKNFDYVDVNLPNAERYIFKYDSIEDIVRHSW